MSLTNAKLVLCFAALPKTHGEVGKAYAQALRRSHPDTAKGCKGRYSLAEIKQAKQVVTEMMEREAIEAAKKINPCPVCKGRGTIQKGFSFTKCPKCKGV